MAMTETSREVGVVLRRRAIDNPWIDHMWSPAMILDEVPATAPWTVLSSETDATIYYAGAASIELFSSDTANYRDNLADGEPRIWVALRRQDGGPELELTKVTADPTEGEAIFESGCDVIGTVPMPPRDRGVDRGLCRSNSMSSACSTSASAIARAAIAGGVPDESVGSKEQGAHERSGPGRRTRAFWRDGRSASRRRRQPEPKPDEPVAEAEARRRSRLPKPRPRRSSISPACRSSRR